MIRSGSRRSAALSVVLALALVSGALPAPATAQQANNSEAIAAGLARDVYLRLDDPPQPIDIVELYYRLYLYVNAIILYQWALTDPRLRAYLQGERFDPFAVPEPTPPAVAPVANCTMLRNVSRRA